MGADRAVIVKITGRVQGVWFRGWTRREATRLGLNGWVRNEADGSVSACISGPPAKVADMVRLLHHGPPGARVDQVETSAAEPGGLRGFDIQRR
ncbi:MAG: acylphosphatase [Pseudomonadota bacterium]